jgi:hypothetical protein
MARVKRKSDTAGGTGGPAHEAVIQRMSNKFAWLMWPSQFHSNFPTVELRSAFRELYPSAFYCFFNFGIAPWYNHPSEKVFQRLNIDSYILLHHARIPFDPPDLTGERTKGQDLPVLKCARAEWWLENRLPLTDIEREFIIEHLPELIDEAKKCAKEVVE